MDAAYFDVVRLAARTYAPDHYLAALLAPAAARDDLITLAAILGDVDRIIATVSEPALAEIRLHWWNDTLAAPRGTRSGNPLADALGEVIARRQLPLSEFGGLLHARSHDLYADPTPSDDALKVNLAAADGASLRLAARCIDGADPLAPLIAAAGEAIGRARLLSTYARFKARGSNPFPQRSSATAPDLPAEIAFAHACLADARRLWATATRADRHACLPLSLVASYLVAVQRGGHDPAQMMAEIAPLTRVVRLWRAHMLGLV